MRKTYLYTTLLLCCSLVFISFANSKKPLAAKPVAERIADSAITEAPEAVLYEALRLDSLGLQPEALSYALKGYNKLLGQGAVTNDRYLTVIDFSQSSRRKRFYLIDMHNREVVMNTYVSHGKNSGVDMANNFSNKLNSEKSSLGFYVTTNTYQGKHGLSLRLSGQEAGFNDMAEQRGIVMHGADYVNAGRVNSAYMGRSQGCPALSEAEYATAINYIKDGSVLFIYHPDARYLNGSELING